MAGSEGREKVEREGERRRGEREGRVRKRVGETEGEREKRKNSENYYYTEFLITLPNILFFFFLVC